MPAQLEIALKPGLFDAEGEKIRNRAHEYFGIKLDNVRVVRIISVDKELPEKTLKKIQDEVFTNPVTQMSSWEGLELPFDWVIWVGYLPGVQDVQGNTAVEAIEDLIKTRFGEEESCYTSKRYLLQGKGITRESCQLIAKELLANDLINQWLVKSKDEWDTKTGMGIRIPRVHLDKTPEVLGIRIDSDDTLKNIGAERNLFLVKEDIPVIRNYFLQSDVLADRESKGVSIPTDVEIEYIAQARSDHCNHNTFRGLFRYRDLKTGETFQLDNLFKTCIEQPTLAIQKNKPWVLSVLWDNAGVGQFDESHCYTITGETHNSPSNMEAYGGALTGIVGVYRDPLGTGKSSKIVMGTYGFCVGDRDYNGPLKPRLHPRRLLDGIIEGVKDGGNKSGIPTTFGLLYFDPCYTGKCLVYVTAVGIMPFKTGDRVSWEKETHDGDLIYMCGGRVGKDGIHGVTASSDAYSDKTPAGHVQIGDPYTQKKMHDYILEARDAGLIEFITDCGGGGLSSAIGESARFSNGCEVDLAKVPLKYTGLDPWEIWVSESQERMIIAVHPRNRKRFEDLAALHDVEVTGIGVYTSTGYLHLTYNNKTCAYIRMEFLQSEFPQWVFDAEWLPPEIRNLHEPVITEPVNHNAVLMSLMSGPNMASFEWITRQYDHEVQGGSVIKPLMGKDNDMPADASAIRPVLDSDKGLAITQAINPNYGKIDTYHMVRVTIDEVVRRLISVGGDPDHIGGVDNFCWPGVRYDAVTNPDGRYKAAQLVRACLALKETCLDMGIPLLSGKDSMYIDGEIEGKFGERKRISGLPSLQFTGISLVNNIYRCVTPDAKMEGDLVYVAGLTKDELGGSEYYHMFDEAGLNVPEADCASLMDMYRAVSDAVQQGVVASLHGIYRGGLAAHLAFVAMGGMLGMEIDLKQVPREKVERNSHVLYSESAGRFIVTIAPENRERFEALMKHYPCACIGTVTGNGILNVKGLEGKTIISLTVTDMKNNWKKRFGDLV